MDDLGGIANGDDLVPVEEAALAAGTNLTGFLAVVRLLGHQGELERIDHVTYVRRWVGDAVIVRIAADKAV